MYDELNKLAGSQCMGQLVDDSANAEATGLNPVEATKTFFGLNLRLLKSKLQLQ